MDLKNPPELTIRDHALQESGGLADLWDMFETHRKRKSSITWDDLDAPPPEWKIDDVQLMATVSTVTAGSTTLGVAVWPRQFIAHQLLAKADVIRAMHERVQLCPGPADRILLSNGKVLVSVVSTTFCECTATRSCRRSELLKSTTRLGRDLFRGYSQDSQKTAWCKPHSALANPELVTKERETLRLRHTWEHSWQPRPRIKAMTLDAVTAGLLLQRPLEARLDEVIETATSTY